MNHLSQVFLLFHGSYKVFIFLDKLCFFLFYSYDYFPSSCSPLNLFHITEFTIYYLCLFCKEITFPVHFKPSMYLLYEQHLIVNYTLLACLVFYSDPKSQMFWNTFLFLSVFNIFFSTTTVPRFMLFSMCSVLKTSSAILILSQKFGESCCIPF